MLSDGVVFANRDLQADIIVDMCTLTGAQVTSHKAILFSDLSVATADLCFFPNYGINILLVFLAKGAQHSTADSKC